MANRIGYGVLGLVLISVAASPSALAEKKLKFKVECEDNVCKPAGPDGATYEDNYGLGKDPMVILVGDEMRDKGDEKDHKHPSKENPGNHCHQTVIIGGKSYTIHCS